MQDKNEATIVSFSVFLKIYLWYDNLIPNEDFKMTKWIPNIKNSINYVNIRGVKFSEFFSESKEYNNHLKLLNIKDTFRQFLTWWTFGPCHNGLWEWYERKKLTIFYTFILGVISTSEPLCAVWMTLSQKLTQRESWTKF